jgi:hypothetical protein
MPQWNAITISAVVTAVVIAIVFITIIVVNFNKSLYGVFVTPPVDPEILDRKTQLALIKKSNCPGCTTLMPTIKKLQSEGINIKLVEGPTMSLKWHKSNGVTSYPTVCIMETGASNRVLKILNPRQRSAEAIRTFAKENAETELQN